MKKCIMIIILLLVIFCICFSLKNNKKDVSTKIVNYSGNNLRISVDGVSANVLPTSGMYYLVDYDCNNISTKVSWDNLNYILNISNETKKSNVSCYLEFKSSPLLSEMSVGSYVAYVGDSNNGCAGNACEGQNANYVSDSDMGYCNSANYKFYVNGWRIAYIENDITYLISAGAPECMCSSLDGQLSGSSCNGSLDKDNISNHYINMDEIALKYCNSRYSKDNICDNTTAWAMNAADFKKIMNINLDANSCFMNYSNKVCGYNNDLIDNGGYYWFATKYGTLNYSLYWYPDFRLVYANVSNSLYGIRPVLKLDSSIIVTGGDGTYESPYTIAVGE